MMKEMRDDMMKQIHLRMCENYAKAELARAFLFRAQEGLTVAHLAKRMGETEYFIVDALSGKKKISYALLSAFALAMDYEIETKIEPLNPRNDTKSAE